MFLAYGEFINLSCQSKFLDLSMTRAQPPLEFIPPALNSLVLRGSQLILPFWLRTSAQIDSVNAEGCDRLAQLYEQFQQKKSPFNSCLSPSQHL